MQQPSLTESDNIYEVRFKNTRKLFFKNANALPLITGDYVVVESDRGFDVGQISLGGIMARLQMRKRKVRADSDRVKKIYRKATKEDVEKLFKAREREQHTLVRTREIIRDLDLDMKLSDVEYQGDNTKAIFYYIADTRVDFRELIKRLANEFRVRVEMKQIGLRHESGLVGGIGSCGRELCCTTWLTDFKTVSTAAARYQNLSLNPMKISGQCGRLKCCLNFELDTYMDALRDIPKVERIETENGLAFLQKTDIFKRIMWFSYQGDSTWIAVQADKVRQLHEMNQSGIKPASLQALDTEAELAAAEKTMDFVDVVGQSVLKEDPKRKKKKNKKKRPEGGQQQSERTGGGSNPRGEGRGEIRNRERQPGTENERREPRNNAERKPQDGSARPQGEGGRNRNRNERGPRNSNQQAGPRNEKQPRGENQRRNEGRGQRPPRPEGQERPPRNDQNQQRQPTPKGEGPKAE